MKKIYVLLLTVLCALCLSLCFAGCINVQNGNNTDNQGQNANNTDNQEQNGGNQNDREQNDDDTQNAQTVQYTFYTQTIGGRDISGVKVKFKSKGKTVKEVTTQDGYARFNLPAAEYDLEYSNLPEGFTEHPDFTVKKVAKAAEDQTKATITTKFSSSVLNTPAGSGKYELGEIAHNFSSTDADGETADLKQLLTEYKLVVINIWYIGCVPCENEFPSMESAYEHYKDDVFIVSLSSHEEDTPNAIKNYKQAHGCTFFMAGYSANPIDKLIITNPTNVFIDRYGVIDFIDSGAQTEESFWTGKFAYYTSDNYGISQETTSGRTTRIIDTKIDFCKILPEKFI